MIVIEMMMACVGVVFIVVALIVRKMNQATSYVYDAPVVRDALMKGRQYKAIAEKRASKFRTDCTHQAMKRIIPDDLITRMYK